VRGRHGDGGARIGITCPPDHPVFSVVGDRLADRGHEVVYFDPTTDIPPADLAALSVLVGKRTRPASVRALVAAERRGVPTWNSATGVMACIAHLTQLCVLSGVGFTVPEATLDPPGGDHVAKGRYHWDSSPTVNGRADVYEPLLAADPVDYKYYAVDDGTDLHLEVLRATSKLYGDKEVIGTADPEPAHVEGIRALLARLGMRGLGVDLVRTEDGWYAVDLNPCPSFAHTGLVDALVDSVEDCLG